jgi:hypothetical protein
MIRAITLVLSIIVTVTPATAFARGGGGGHSSGGHSSSGHSPSSHSSSSHSSSSHPSSGRYSTGYHSTRVSSHSGNINVMSDHSVRSYFKTDGTFVQPYRATNPNETRLDNYSTKGNVNPYTGVPGAKPVTQP